MEKQEVAIEILQIKKAMLLKQAKRSEFALLQEKLKGLNKEEKQIYENNIETIQKVLTIYLEEIKKYMEAESEN